MPLPAADSGAIPKTYDELYSLLIEPACVDQCHKGGAAPKGLSLEPHRFISGLVGVPSVEVPELLRVAPGQASESYLIVKLVASDARRVGSRMPRNGPPYFSNQQIFAVKQWINAGATTDWEADESPTMLPGGGGDASDGDALDGDALDGAAGPDAPGGDDDGVEPHDGDEQDTGPADVLSGDGDDGGEP